jgi:hypothetical protein
MSRNFLIPVSLATSALISSSANAAINNNQPKAASKTSSDQSSENLTISGTTTQVLHYLKGDEKHELFMKRSEAGLVFADHSSHASHGSHGSHGSHRSGR